MPFTEVDRDIWVCDDCGAYAKSVEDISHFDSCRPGESEYWEKHYRAADISGDDEEKYFGVDTRKIERDTIITCLICNKPHTECKCLNLEI